MSSIYSCPVHVDRQSADPRSLCPLCGQRPILLRASAELGGDPPAAAAGERPESGTPDGAGPKPRQRGRAAPQDGHAVKLAQEVDHAIELLSSIRDRLRALT
jgi:hypothetical protein